MIKRIFHSQTKSVALAAGILGISTLLSRLLGLLRNRLLASSFGAGQELDVYFAAFRLPDLVFNVLIAGGILVSFLPIFSEIFLKDEKDGWRFVNNLLGVFTILIIAISFIFFLFTPFFVKLITPGFSGEQFDLTVSLTRMMFLSPLILGLSNIFSGILHFFNRFIAYSLSPIAYNLGIIFGIIFLVPLWGITGIAIGVLVGAFLHLSMQIVSAAHCGFKFGITFNFKGRGIKKVFTLMIPRIAGIAASQLNLLAITAIASVLEQGSISIFNFVNNVYDVPVGIIGISFAVASFPTLTRFWSEGEKKKMVETFNSISRKIILFVLPLSFAFFILRTQIVRILFGSGKFNLTDAKLTSASLGLLALGVLAGSLIPLVFRVFFATKDTKTPTLISIFSVLVNVILSFLFVYLLSFNNAFRFYLSGLLNIRDLGNISVVGLALAFSCSVILQLILFLFFLAKKMGGIGLRKLISFFSKVLLNSFAMSFVLYLSLNILSGFLNMNTFLGIFLQTLIASTIGLAVYFLLSFFSLKDELKSSIRLLIGKKV